MRNNKGIILILLVITSSILLNIKINSNNNTNNQKDDIKNFKNETPQTSDDFIPDPPGIYSGKYWNFTTGEIVGWRVSTDYFTQDKIYNISDLKYFTAAENVTGNDEPYYGVQLTPAYYNISTNKVEEFINRTVFPLLNASLINYTLSKYGIFSFDNLHPFAFMNDNGGPEFFLNLFVPTNSSNDLLDIYWVADALHWSYSTYLNGNFDPVYGYPQPPQTKEELCDLTVTSNSIEYSNPSKGTYCNLYYYDNGTLRTGELKALFMPQMTLTINWTRMFDFNPLNDLKWSEDFDAAGDKLYIGMDTNETMLVFNHTVDNMELEIKWDGDDEEWDIELWYYQEIWANVSYWHFEDKKWIYLNCTPVASANELYPIVFGGGDDDDDEVLVPPMLLIPNQSTYFSLADVFRIFELNPEWSDLRVESADNYVKLTNTSTSNIVVFSYQKDGILKYIYLQEVEPFSDISQDRMDEDILFFYKNYTAPLTIGKNTFSLHTFDLGSLSASINVSIDQITGFYHSGFPYNPTNQSISNALGFFDIFLEDDTDLDETYYAPINITFHYNHKTYKSVKVYWFNISADNDKGAWEELPIIDLGNGVIILSLNHTSIIAFTASKIYLPTGGGDDDDDEEKEAAIPFGNFYLLFLAIGIIGLLIFERRKYFKK